LFGEAAKILIQAAHADLSATEENQKYEASVFDVDQDRTTLVHCSQQDTEQ
jgi:hypothetical protein